MSEKGTADQAAESETPEEILQGALCLHPYYHPNQAMKAQQRQIIAATREQMEGNGQIEYI